MPQSEHLKRLLTRYNNKIFLTDDFDNYGVILHNDSEYEVKLKLCKFKYSKFGRTSSNTTIDGITHLFNLPFFAEYAIGRGCDWVFFTRDEWINMNPVKPKKIKPRREFKDPRKNT